MEAYPPDYIAHNLPLVLLSGLESAAAETPIAEKSRQYLGDGGFRIRADLAPVHHPLKDDLRATLLSYDCTAAPWHSQSTDKTEQPPAFKIRSVGRAYTFPPRKAPPPPHAPRLKPENDSGFSPPHLSLHSTLSPLTPSSPLYPDGIITPVWITKHLHRLPSVLVSFYNLVADTTTSSLEDNKIKAEVNNIRSLITSTNYKTKFVIVLVADGLINSSELEERLVNIRRGTNFDSKALYFLPSASTVPELKDFAKVLLATIHPACIEYYRDLSKHARRKRNRNAVPQPTVPPTQGTSSVLPLQGWNVRYEFKLGIFAETRQELEAASRNYEQAYEGLFHPELFGESISPRSPRFNEARMLADIIVIRIIRCLLWSSQTTAAVRWWIKHRDRTQEIIDKRERGTTNYGWEAWLTIWTKVMAELVRRSNVFTFASSQLPPGALPPVQILPVKGVVGQDRQLPWEQLHHEGYWLNIVRRHIAARRQLTSQMSVDEEEAHIGFYDNYLCPGPKMEKQLLATDSDDYIRQINSAIGGAVEAFSAREQTRMIGALRFYGLEESHMYSTGPVAESLLQSLWRDSSWRAQGWWILFAQVGEMLLHSAAGSGEHELYLRLFWELKSVRQLSQTESHAALTQATSTAIDMRTCASAIAVSFAFSSGTGHVGEEVAAQLTLKRTTDIVPLDMQIMEIKLAFDGGISPILLSHEAGLSPSASDSTVMEAIELSDAGSGERKSNRLSLPSTSYCCASTDLSLAGTRNKVFNFNVVPREAGPGSVTSIVVLLSNGTQELTLNVSDPLDRNGIWWETRNGSSVCRDFGMHRDVTTITILPKPPKVEISLPNHALTYYTNESVHLEVNILNGEEGEISGELTACLISPATTDAKLQWKREGRSGRDAEKEAKAVALAPVTITAMKASTAQTHGILLLGLTESMDHELELTVTYKLASDMEFELMKRTTVDISVVRPFEANSSFMPRLHDEPWPNFFAAPGLPSEDQPQGLKQKYLVRADVGCFARETLIVRALELKSRRIIGGAKCSASLGRSEATNETHDLLDHGFKMQSEQTHQFFFDLEMQKLLLGDRTPVAVDFAIDISWSRAGSEVVNVSTLLLPKFMAPMSEPRVLLRASKMEGHAGMYLLTYTIENPSLHFLTFNATMESGEGFAFSGPKMKTISLVPISRYDVQYRLFAQKRNEWVRVHLEVLDAFFGQTLRIQPASDGIRADKQGNVQIFLDG